MAFDECHIRSYSHPSTTDSILQASSSIQFWLKGTIFPLMSCSIWRRRFWSDFRNREWLIMNCEMQSTTPEDIGVMPGVYSRIFKNTMDPKFRPASSETYGTRFQKLALLNYAVEEQVGWTKPEGIPDKIDLGFLAPSVVHGTNKAIDR